MQKLAMISRWALTALGLAVFACSGTPRQTENPSTTSAAGTAYTELPPDEENEVPTEVSEEPEVTPEEPEAPCELSVDEPDALRQLSLFRRWLQDQVIGRYLTVESLTPTCGNREGMFVAELTLTGSAGNLQSLGNALEAYFPGSSWTARDHERLEGEGYRMRLTAEVQLPTGAEPRPRCTWDSNTECE